MTGEDAGAGLESDEVSAQHQSYVLGMQCKAPPSRGSDLAHMLAALFERAAKLDACNARSLASLSTSRNLQGIARSLSQPDHVSCWLVSSHRQTHCSISSLIRASLSPSPSLPAPRAVPR
jgi:hypothetical protein